MSRRPPPGLAEAKPLPRVAVRSGGSARHADEPELLVVSLDDPLEDLADPGDVVLLLRLRLERAELARHERPLERAVRHRDRPAIAEHVRLVESLAPRVVLLSVVVARPRVGGHDDPRLGAADA